YTHCRAHVDDHVERVRHMVKRYMRRFADRFLQAGGSYSDACVGPQELRRLAGLPESQEGQAFLDRVGFPSPEDIAQALMEWEHHIESRMVATLQSPEPLSLPIEELRAGFMLNDTELDLLIAASAPRLNVDMSRLMTVA